MPISVTADPIDVTVSTPRIVLSSYPGRSRDTALYQEFSVPEDDGAGLIVTLALLGTWGGTSMGSGTIVVTTSLQGTWRSALVVTATPITVTLNLLSGFSSSGGVSVFTSGPKDNWVKWSNIGSLDFTIDRSNVAGERPLDWKGVVYTLLTLKNKLETRVVAYGANGVSVLPPAGNTYGLFPIYDVGIKSKHAVVAAGTSTHYFVDRKSQLWKLSDGLTLLDYSEYLSALTSPVLTWESDTQLLYICDGTVGFVYSPEAESLGRGPTNITGIGIQDGSRYIIGTGTITVPVLEIVTDIYDLGSRYAKSIQSIEWGINATVQLETRIEFRQKKNAAFLITNWYPLDSRGVRYIQCYGYEFKFHLRAESAVEFLRPDYVRVNGIVHDH